MEELDKLITEFNDLYDKINEVKTSLASNKNENRLYDDLLIGQMKAMETYLSILHIRIGLNTSKSDKTTPTENEEVNA